MKKKKLHCEIYWWVQLFEYNFQKQSPYSFFKVFTSLGTLLLTLAKFGKLVNWSKLQSVVWNTVWNREMRFGWEFCFEVQLFFSSFFLNLQNDSKSRSACLVTLFLRSCLHLVVSWKKAKRRFLNAVISFFFQVHTVLIRRTVSVSSIYDFFNTSSSIIFWDGNHIVLTSILT